MKMTLLGLVIIALSLFFLKGKLDVYKVENEGKVVNMKIVTLPASCGYTKGSYYMNVEYGGQIFNKRIPTGYCESHKLGDIIQLKYLEGQETLLFPDEKLQSEFIAIGVFLFVGVLSLLIGIFYKGK